MKDGYGLDMTIDTLHLGMCKHTAQNTEAKPPLVYLKTQMPGDSTTHIHLDNNWQSHELGACGATAVSQQNRLQLKGYDTLVREYI